MHPQPLSRSLKIAVVLFTLALAAGCSHPRSATEIAKAHGMANVDALSFTPAAKTTTVGKSSWVSPTDSIAVIELNRKAFPVNSFLVGRDHNLKPTSVLVTTKNIRGKFQGVLLVAGTLGSDDEVVQPGPELAAMVQQNIDTYLAAKQAPAAPATEATTTPATITTPVAPATDPAATTPAPAATTDTPAPTPTVVPTP